MIKKVSLYKGLACFEAVDGFSIRRTMKSDQTFYCFKKKVNMTERLQKFVKKEEKH